MRIRWYSRVTYGQTRAYIADETTKAIISELTRRKALDARDLDALEAMGHKLELVPDPRGTDMRGRNIERESLCTPCNSRPPKVFGNDRPIPGRIRIPFA